VRCPNGDTCTAKLWSGPGAVIRITFPVTTIKTIKTQILRQAYERSGPKKGEPVFLVHGWPDSPRTWDQVLPHLHREGYQTIVPYLRGYGPTSFRKPLFKRTPRRTGQPVAFAHDMMILARRLGIRRLHFVGHDWGARTGYALAALFPERIQSLVAISVPFEPGKPEPPKLAQARAFWYQWFLCTKPGEKKFREDPIAYGKAQWDTWSPPGWYESKEFEQAAQSWQGEDFEDVVLHGYRSRWGHAEMDPRYAMLQSRFESTRTLETPTVLIHGVEDRCELLATTEGVERNFSASYRRILLEGVGHFPQRENPEQTAQSILEQLNTFGSSD
jgi:pimeloyl-ACP methyl ester carboxylesterase